MPKMYEQEEPGPSAAVGMTRFVESEPKVSFRAPSRDLRFYFLSFPKLNEAQGKMVAKKIRSFAALRMTRLFDFFR